VKELGLVMIGCVVFTGFFAEVIYPDLKYTGSKSNSTCYGECYEEYVRQFGTVVEQEQRKQQLAAGDPFSDIRSLWSGCAACHGANGNGGIGPKLTGQTGDYISSRLVTYKNNGTVGPQSALMWGQAAMLSDSQITQLGKFIEEGLPGK
jgi:cytochrome c553